MISRVCNFLLLFLFLVSSGLVFPLPTSFQVVTRESGLTSNRINTIFKDSRGFIWLGTQVGINRFDGNSVKQYEAVGNAEVFSINETDEVFLWIGTENGVIKLNRMTNQVENVDLGMPNISVRKIEVDEDLNVYLATNRGLYIVGIEGIQHVIFEDGISNSNLLTGITTTDSINYWFSSFSGICHYNSEDKSTKVYKYSTRHSDFNNYTSITHSGSDLYVGAYNKGVIKFDVTTKEFDVIPDFVNNYILTICCHRNNLYIGTNGEGLKIYSLEDHSLKEIRHEIKDPNSINSNAIYSFLLDEDIYWIGTYKGGLNYNPSINDFFQIYQTGKFNSFDYNVRSFYIAPNGDKLIGTRNGFIFISEQRHVYRKYTQNDSSILSSDIILYIAPFKDDQYLIGTYGGGMYVYDTQKLRLLRFRDEEVFVTGCVFRFVKDEDDIWWIATDRGLFEYQDEDQTLRSYSTANSRLLNNNILYLYLDSKKRLWIGTSDGLCIFDRTSKIISSDFMLFPPELKVIISVFEDSEGNFWVGSHQAFARLNESLSQLTPVAFNQENVGIMSIIEDEHKFLWLATTQGIIHYNILNSQYKTYNISDGVLNYDFANVVQSTSPLDIWWANEKGLIHCYLPDLKNINRSHKPVVTDIYLTKNQSLEITGRAPEFTDKLLLSADNNDIRFGFSLLRYSYAQADIYEYMLAGYDKTWKTQIGNNEASYYRLPPGKYTFSIRDINDHTLVSAISIVVRRNIVKVLIPYLFIALLLLLFVVLYRYRGKAIRKLKEKFTTEKYVHSKIDHAEMKKISKQLENYMKTDKPYMNPELKQSEVAKKLKISSGELSQILNQFLGISYTDYLNKFRIDELVERIKDKSSIKYTLTAIAEQCGFSSRSSFFRAVKKHTGQTPADFLKKVGRKHMG